ncbi:NUDIX domain-containing protein [Streptomyces sp. TG1A-8]|uniref:bifunctional class I SAM-dependent methyltransferase/NUDIX hydrolase n=1 Tax=Streptomyces sp. TG1A-8 TaxID=3051385 RepID=UPI00265C23EB|nr:NUDIX domain-containing protein [Streptomyces sp. TG1A-8]MDO0929359.1 NUDIX domain-containing protein [Streptomyces sp. TG1A-8]
MGDTTTGAWDAHYAAGRSFRELREPEKALFAERLPAPGGGTALEVGCGLGELARFLGSLGYTVDAVDFSAEALARAERSTPAGSGVRYLCRDVERDELPDGTYDVIVFRRSWAFVRDRTRVVNRLRERLRAGGALCVVTPVAGRVPGSKRGIALDEDEISALCAGWGVVERYDVDGAAFVVLREPVATAVVCAAPGRPSAHALTGAGVVVTDAAGRVLLGWSLKRGGWELPGGKNDAGEDFAAAGVRELAEETGLVADPAGARVVALLMDSTHGMPRLTAAVRVASYTGEPVVAEPQLIRRWEWHEVADLPALAQPLFTPSAHVLDTVWPGLLRGLPPVHRYPVAPVESPPPGTPA